MNAAAEWVLLLLFSTGPASTISGLKSEDQCTALGRQVWAEVRHPHKRVNREFGVAFYCFEYNKDADERE